MQGPCEKIHDDELKAKFNDEATASKRSLYLDDFLRFCQRMLQDLKSRISRAKERLILTQERDERMLAGQSNRCHICKRHCDENCIVVVKLPRYILFQ